MHTIAHYAAVIILTSALGAFVLCLLVIRYGFTPAEDEPLPVRHRRFFVTRLGHAAGAVCFAITAALAGVALSMASRAPTPPAPATVDVTPLRAGQARLAHDVRTLDERIERTEAALAELRAAKSADAPRRAAAARPPRSARRAVTTLRPDTDDVVRAPAASPTHPPEGDNPAAIPRATTDFATDTPREPAATAPPSPARTAPPADNTVRLGDTMRAAADGMSRLGTEIRRKAMTATRAVRDFLRDL